MKLFWQLVGKSYIALASRKKMLKALLIFICLIGNLLFLIAIYGKVCKLEKNLDTTKTSLTASINRVYSQIYNINTRLPFVEKNSATKLPVR